MDSNAVTISEVISGMLLMAKSLGVSDSALWRGWEPLANAVVVFYRKRGVCEYSSEITEEYLRLCEQRFENGEIAESSVRRARYIVRRIHEFYTTGTLRTFGAERCSRYCISPANAHLVDAFISEHGYSENTCDDISWAVKRYLHHFEMGCKILYQK